MEELRQQEFEVCLTMTRQQNENPPTSQILDSLIAKFLTILLSQMMTRNLLCQFIHPKTCNTTHRINQLLHITLGRNSLRPSWRSKGRQVTDLRFTPTQLSAIPS